MNRGIIFWRKVALVHGIRNEATSMKLYEPCFAAQFHCLAGACPDTCCKDWEHNYLPTPMPNDYQVKE